MSGLLLASGAVYVFGAVNTLTACLDSRCGGANPLPLVLFAAVVFGFGMAAGAGLIRHQ